MAYREHSLRPAHLRHLLQLRRVLCQPNHQNRGISLRSRLIQSMPRPPATKEVEHCQGKSVAATKVVKDSNKDVAVGVGTRNKVAKKATKAVKDSSKDVAIGVGKGESTTSRATATCRAVNSSNNQQLSCTSTGTKKSPRKAAAVPQSKILRHAAEDWSR